MIRFGLEEKGILYMVNKINIFDGTSRANRMAELEEVRIALCYSCLIKSCLNNMVEGVNNNGENIEAELCSFYLQCRR